MKLSTAKAFCDEPTERQNITGTWVFLSATSTLSASTSIGRVDEPFDRLRFDAVDDLAPAERARDRADSGAEVERCRRAVVFEGGAHLQRRLRAIAVALDVLLARPDQLDRPLERLRDLDRLTQFVGIR